MSKPLAISSVPLHGRPAPDGESMERRRPAARAAIGVVSACVIAGALTQACGGEVREPDAEVERGSQLTELQRSEIAALEALGYVHGDRPAGEETMVVLHDRTKALQGFNLYTAEHAWRAFLIDMDGRLLHFWEIPKIEGRKDKLKRVRLLENGELLALLERRAMYRLDRHSNVLWHFRGRVHHDFDVAHDGTIYVLIRRAGIYPSYDADRPILNEAIRAISPEGEVLETVWMLDAIQRSSCCSDFLDYAEAGDIFHTNAVHILDGSLEHRHPAFRAGNILTSFRYVNAIAVVDMAAGRVVWGYRGPFVRQHDPTVLDSGNILLFDNEAPPHGLDGRSRVLELDPFEDRIVWKFPPTPDIAFYSRTGATSERLANGNTLITESRAGRVVEVTHDMEVVWTFVNPARVPEDENNIARIFEMQRLPGDLALDWIPPHDYPEDALSAFQTTIPDPERRDASSR